jgi:hypothetical protein
LKNNNILKLGIIGTLILIVLASGCIFYSSTSEIKTYSDGVMSFNYPADFDNDTNSSSNYTTSNSHMQTIGLLENTAPLRDHNIWVGKNLSATSPTEARNDIVSSVKNMSKGEVISINTETNPNGIVIEETTYTDEYLFGLRARYCDMFFKINDSVYRITVCGHETPINTRNIINTTRIIFQSIK